jgi:hypothetical protein
VLFQHKHEVFADASMNIEFFHFPANSFPTFLIRYQINLYLVQAESRAEFANRTYFQPTITKETSQEYCTLQRIVQIGWLSINIYLQYVHAKTCQVLESNVRKCFSLFLTVPILTLYNSDKFFCQPLSILL